MKPRWPELRLRALCSTRAQPEPSSGRVQDAWTDCTISSSTARAATSCRRRASASARRRWRRCSIRRCCIGGAAARRRGAAGGPLLAAPHFVPRVRRVIYLFQSGGPSQLDLFDHKPLLRTMNGEELPASVRMGQRLTGMTAFQKSLPMAGSQFEFARHGKSRRLGQRADAAHRADRRRAVLRAVDAHRGDQPRSRHHVLPDRLAAGRPAVDGRLAVLRARLREREPARRSSSCCRAPAKATSRSTRGCGAAASCRRSIRACSSAAARIRCSILSDPDGLDRASRRRMLDTLRAMEEQQHARVIDPEIDARIAQYEMAYRMQTAVPDGDGSRRRARRRRSTCTGPDARTPGTYAANCLLARRLAERNVRFIQLYHQGWDQHGNLPKDIRTMAKSVDQAVGGAGARPEAARAARRHAGDLGRRVRPHQLLAGQADEGQLRPRSPPALLHDVDGRRRREDAASASARPTSSATTSRATRSTSTTSRRRILHLLGVDHERLLFKHQGRRYRLTDVHGHVVKDLLA